MNRKFKNLLLSGTCALSVAGLSGCAGVLVAGGTAGVTAAGDPRTAGTLVEDNAIEIKIRNAIFADQKAMQQARVGVTSYNGVVLLVGQVPTEELRADAVEIATTTPKVRAVHNELTVGTAAPMSSASQDTWLTAKIKSRLLATRDINALRVKVVTEGSTVYLLGLIDRQQGDVVAEVARHIEGVERVVKLFEYTD